MKDLRTRCHNILDTLDEDELRIVLPALEAFNPGSVRGLWITGLLMEARLASDKNLEDAYDHLRSLNRREEA